GSIGKRRFTKGSMSASTADHLNREEEKEELRPSPFLASVPPQSPAPPQLLSATSRHKRKSSLATIHPSSLDAQRLLAAVGSSARAKGMVFDDQLGRWIKTPRKRVSKRMRRRRIRSKISANFNLRLNSVNLRLFEFTMQIGHIDAVPYCVTRNPPLIEIDENLIRIVHEALGIADAEDSALLGGKGFIGSGYLMPIRYTLGSTRQAPSPDPSAPKGTQESE
ncbi:uncharacterized protein JCM6883_001247, partial [Sporobolomyces salmoneus]|uniref:uncharacterized protein n=1 Tax=Sporobolomyces salmoneus TaxID=183962 RepID=UPI00317DEEF6